MGSLGEAMKAGLQTVEIMKRLVLSPRVNRIVGDVNQIKPRQL